MKDSNSRSRLRKLIFAHRFAGSQEQGMVLLLNFILFGMEQNIINIFSTNSSPTIEKLGE